MLFLSETSLAFAFLALSNDVLLLCFTVMIYEQYCSSSIVFFTWI